MPGLPPTDGVTDQPGRIHFEPAPALEQAATTGATEVRKAARALALSGPRMGFSLLIVGMLLGAVRALEPAAAGGTSVAGRMDAIARGVGVVLGFGLAGWGLALVCQVTSALILEHVERSGSATRELIAELRGLTAALGRWFEAGHRPSDPTDSPASDSRDRMRRLAAIDRASRSESWEEARRLIAAFEEEFPGDPIIAATREQLEAGHRQAMVGKLAELDAARQVNDPGRVIELYLGVASSLEDERRRTLECDLARWFLGVIHRRLRSGKIQPEVVTLATQVAETFAATVEGASMRAALPTLRRSVGLCPRCAQPYKGTADACPACLGGTSGWPAGPSAEALGGPS